MRIYTRKFDWDEAKRRHANGETIQDIADSYGVTKTAVRFAVNPDEYARSRAYSAEYQRTKKPYMGTCRECGGPATAIRSESHIRAGRCRSCYAKHQATTVRETTLQCSACRYWLPDDAFPNQTANTARRGRHSLCRPCQNVAKQLNRESNRERERAYDRARKRAARNAT